MDKTLEQQFDEATDQIQRLNYRLVNAKGTEKTVIEKLIKEHIKARG